MERLKSSVVKLASSIGSRYYNLPATKSRKISIDRDLKIPMRDGVELAADRHFPENTENPPTILIRSVYGRRGFWEVFARWFAEREMQVLIQSCRGTADSGGTFQPFVNEAEDGIDTVDWLREQSWFGDSLATWGSSYLGYNQWALVSEEIPELQAMAIQVAPSEFHDHVMYPGNAFAVGNALAFLQMIKTSIIGNPNIFRQILGKYRMENVRREGATRIPLREADQEAFGETFDYFQKWIDCESQDSYWEAIDHRPNVENVPAAQLIAGWHDVFLPAMIADFKALRSENRPVQLIITPNTHNEAVTATLREQFEWIENQVNDKDSSNISPRVKLHLMGADQWLEFEDFPPEGIEKTCWYLHADNGLSEKRPTDSIPDSFHFDPKDPTPNIGGPIQTLQAGQQDQSKKEARDDVLIYTSEPLPDDLDIIGRISTTLYVKSSAESADFYVGICDVNESGVSKNVTDGLERLSQHQLAENDDEPARIEIGLRPIAYRFNRGHRIRIQIASGAFPRWSRNPGTGECIGDATQLLQTNQEIYHEPDYLSAVDLPIYTN